MVHVQPPEMAVARPTEVHGIPRPFPVGMNTELRCIARSKEILNVVVGNPNALMLDSEGVESTVGVLPDHIEICEVVLVAVRSEGPEETHSGFVVGKNETAEVTAEKLSANAQGHSIKRRTDLSEPSLSKCLLNSGVTPTRVRKIP